MEAFAALWPLWGLLTYLAARLYASSWAWSAMDTPVEMAQSTSWSEWASWHLLVILWTVFIVSVLLRMLQSIN